MPPTRSKRPADAPLPAPKRVCILPPLPPATGSVAPPAPCTNKTPVVRQPWEVLSATEVAQYAGAPRWTAPVVLTAVARTDPAPWAPLPAVLSAAARQHNGALRRASRDRTIVLSAVRQYDWAERNHGDYRAVRQFHSSTATEVTQDGWALWHASPALRADREIVPAAVAQNGRALQWADPALRPDRPVLPARALEWDEPLQEVADVLCNLKRKHRPLATKIKRCRLDPSADALERHTPKMKRCRLDPSADALERHTGTDIPILVE